MPLVYETRDWNHGVFVGATLSSETTAAAVGQVGVVRRDPMAMLPFIGYNAADYVGHWLDIGKQADASKLPKIYQVNWFRRDVNEDGTAGKFLWPGFGDNARVLKWVIERLDGTGEGVDTPVGVVPAPGALDVSGLDMTDEDIAKALAEPTADSIAVLKQAVDTLQRYPQVHVTVAGYTDSIGSDAYNMSLSERRAKIVYDYLTSHGIDASRLDGPIGHGKNDPIGDNATDAGRAQNRRTELQVKQ